MAGTLHITDGDSVGDALAESGLPGEILVWRDILYDGPRDPGWPTDDGLDARAEFLADATGGGLSKDKILRGLEVQYRKLATATDYASIVLWFDACLFDQSMLAHILTGLNSRGIREVDLVCIDAFPGIIPFDGLGQLQPHQLAPLVDQRCPVTEAQFRFAEIVDRAFAIQDAELFADLVRRLDAPLPSVPAAVARWLQEQPDPETGLGRLEQLALTAIRAGCERPGEIFAAVSKADTHPQFWGDTTLWKKINGLAAREPPLVRIAGPAPRVPQWKSPFDLNQFSVTSR